LINGDEQNSKIGDIIIQEVLHFGITDNFFGLYRSKENYYFFLLEERIIAHFKSLIKSKK
jgi:hypothetical protein